MLEPESRRARLGQEGGAVEPRAGGLTASHWPAGAADLASHGSLGLRSCRYIAEEVTIVRTRMTRIHRHGTWLAPRGMMDG